MKSYKKPIYAVVFTFLLAVSFASFLVVPTMTSGAPPPETFSRVILISWDGIQYNHLMDLYNAGNMSNLARLASEGIFVKALITSHPTSTNYGHTAMLSGAGGPETCPDNRTVWEHIEEWNNSWITGGISGKDKFTDVIFPNAYQDVDFWYAQDNYSDVITDLTIEFIQNYSSSSFFLFVHYRDPDSAGHAYGENSQQYEDAVIECDNQTGRIISTLESEGIYDSTAIIVLTDHGFIEGSKDHWTPKGWPFGGDPNTYTIFIASNRGTVNPSEEANEFWDQQDVAPTIYSIIGINDYRSRWTYINTFALWDRAFDIRDVAMTNVIIFRTIVGHNVSGGSTEFYVAIENRGNYTEVPTVKVYYNNILVTPGVFPPTLYPERSTTLAFKLYTENLPKGTYNVMANLSVIPAATSQPGLAYTINETVTTNNALVDGDFKVTITGDIDGDGYVYVLDLSLLGGSWRQRTGGPKYNPNADIDCDGYVYVLDLSLLGAHWRQRDP